MRTFAITAAAALTLSLALAGTAAAKGPFDIEVSGGDLGQTVTVAGPFTNEDIYPVVGAPQVDVEALESREPFVVAFVVDHPDTGERVSFVELNYYPQSGNVPATFHDPRGDFIPSLFAWEAPDEIEQTLLDAGIGQADDGDDTSIAWFLIPAGLVGLVVAGGIGSRYLVRRAGHAE
jgi:hypothetical protein